MLPGSVPRLVRRPLGWDLAPVEGLRLVRADAHPVALFGTWADGTDVISSEPVLVASPPCSLGQVLDSPVLPGTTGGGGGAGRPRELGAAPGRAVATGLTDCRPSR